MPDYFCHSLSSPVVLYISQLLIICVLATQQNTRAAQLPENKQQNENTVDESDFYAGRSKEEYRYVKSKVQELEELILEKFKGIDGDQVKNITQTLQDIRDGAIGDILLTAADVDRWLTSAKANTRTKRSVVHNFEEYPNKKWTMPIKYMIDKSTLKNVTSQRILRSNIAEWEKQTCVKFEEVLREPNEQYLWFINRKGHGCNSYIGKAEFREMRDDWYSTDHLSYHPHRQPIHLEDPGCFHMGGLPLHEIGHALGLYHEAQRLDRDEYLDVYLQNVKPGELGNFLQPSDHSSIDTKGTPYDLGSIMQYGSLDFSIDQDLYLGTSIPKDIKKANVMGQRVEIGFYDAKIINLAYCSVEAINLKCENDGYADPKNHSRCKCPAEWSGDTCDTITKGSAGCAGDGEVIHTSEDYGQVFSLYSPNYKNSKNWEYHPGDQCFWKIKVPQSYQIVWWIGHSEDNSGTGYFIGMPMSTDIGCQAWVEVKRQGETRGQRICGASNDTLKAKDFITPEYSHEHTLHINFQSFDVYMEIPEKVRNITRRGFHLQYKLEPYTPAPPTSTPIEDYDYYDFDDLLQNLLTTTRKRYWWEGRTTKDPLYWLNEETTQRPNPKHWYEAITTRKYPYDQWARLRTTTLKTYHRMETTTSFWDSLFTTKKYHYKRPNSYYYSGDYYVDHSYYYNHDSSSNVGLILGSVIGVGLFLCIVISSVLGVKQKIKSQRLSPNTVNNQPSAQNPHNILAPPPYSTLSIPLPACSNPSCNQPPPHISHNRVCPPPYSTLDLPSRFACSNTSSNQLPSHSSHNLVRPPPYSSVAMPIPTLPHTHAIDTGMASEPILNPIASARPSNNLDPLQPSNENGKKIVDDNRQTPLCNPLPISPLVKNNQNVSTIPTQNIKHHMSNVSGRISHIVTLADIRVREFNARKKADKDEKEILVYSS